MPRYRYWHITDESFGIRSQQTTSVSVCPYTHFPDGTAWTDEIFGVLPSGCDTVPYPATRNTVVPITTRTATSYAGSVDGRTWNNWFVEPIEHQCYDLYQELPIFVQDLAGTVRVGWLYHQEFSTLSESVVGVRRHINFDGGRNDCVVDPYSNYVQKPGTNDWYGIDLSGRLFLLESTGKVTTLAGKVTSKAITPLQDDTATLFQIEAFNKVTVGTFDTFWLAPNDLCVDTTNSNIIYVADSQNHRITRTDLSANPVTTVTYAGSVGNFGHVDGDRLTTALFNNPTSVSMAGIDLYVTDFGGSGGGASFLREIDTVTGAVTTFPANPAVAQALAVRPDQNTDLIFVQQGTKTLHRLTKATNVNTTLQTFSPANGFGGTTGSWLWLDVDTAGTCGPIGDIFVVYSVGSGRAELWRMDGNGQNAVHAGGSGPVFQGPVTLALDVGGHYTWALGLSRTEARLITSGFGSMGAQVIRRKVAGDPNYTNFLSNDFSHWLNGHNIYCRGTVVGGPTRPSFALLRGLEGFGYLGLPTFDELAFLDDNTLAAYIQAGMGGGTPRPEITGTNLCDLIFYIRMQSIRGIQEELTFAGLACSQP